MSPDETLTEFIRRLRALKGVAAIAAREAAPLVEDVVRSNASRGVDPEGQTWTPKKDGGRPLANVAGAIRTLAKGSMVQIGLTGHYVFHHFSKSKTLPRRRVIPGEGRIPANVVAALREGARRAFLRVMGGAA